jgi:hypothetical protein
MTEKRFETKKCKVNPRKPLVVSKHKRSHDADNPQEAQTKGSSIFEPGYKFFGQFTYRPSITMDLLVVTTIAVEMYLYIKYGIILKDPAATTMLQFNILNIVFCVIGRFVWGVLQYKIVPFDLFNVGYSLSKKTKNILYKSPNEDRFTALDGVFALVIWIVITFTQLIRFVNLNVSALDQFLFYVFAAPAEESFFRYFLVASMIMASAMIIQKVSNRNVKRWEEVIIKATVGFFVGVVFGLAHSARYENADLFVIILNGIELSVVYAFFRRIDMILLAHVFLNIRAGISVFT